MISPGKGLKETLKVASEQYFQISLPQGKFIKWDKTQLIIFQMFLQNLSTLSISFFNFLKLRWDHKVEMCKWMARILLKQHNSLLKKEVLWKIWHSPFRHNLKPAACSSGRKNGARVSNLCSSDKPQPPRQPRRTDRDSRYHCWWKRRGRICVCECNGAGKRGKKHLGIRSREINGW